jgi:hypothetical protein
MLVFVLENALGMNQKKTLSKKENRLIGWEL